MYKSPWIWSDQYSLRNLSDQDRKLVKQLSEQRLVLSRSNGLVEWARDESLDVYERYYVGLNAECGFCWCYLLDPEKHIRIAGTKDPGWDIEAFGKKHGVQGSKSRNPSLFVRDNNKCDFLWLCQVDRVKQRIRYIGYYPTSKIDSAKRAGILKPYKETFFIKEYDLYPWEWLPFHCKFGDEWLSWIESANYWDDL